MFIMESTSSVTESQTTDEGAHLAAGYSYLVQKDFRLNREHPPLLKQIAAIPLVLLGNRVDRPFDTSAWDRGDQWAMGQELLYFNQVPADRTLFLGRLGTMLLSLVLGLYLFKWTHELFGTGAAILTLILYAFAPNVIAHSRYITTDMAMTAFFFITIYYFYKYLKSARPLYLWLTAIFFAIAQASKFSAVLLVPIMICLYLVAALHQSHGNTPTRYSIRHVSILILTLMITTGMLLFAVYGFTVTKPIDDWTITHLLEQRADVITEGTFDAQPELIRRVIAWTDETTPVGQHVWWLMEHVPIPFFAYFDGLVSVYTHNYFGHTGYLLGNHTEYGWWYYFPIAFLVKTPTVILLSLLGLAIWTIWWLRTRLRTTHARVLLQKIPLHMYFLTIPPLIWMGLSMMSSLNIGIRHILVIYPFIHIGVGWALWKLWQSSRKVLNVLAAIAIVWYVASSVWIFPHYLAYFNEVSGGPQNGTTYLVDSNIDWGQDVKKLKSYMVDNAIDHVCFVYFGQANLEYYDIDYRYLPDVEQFIGTDAIDCVVVISATALLSEKGEYSWLLNYTPDEKIGYSLFVYDFREDTRL